MKISRLLNILLIVICVLLLLGISFVFNPCGPKEDGSFMNCHWAGVYVRYMAIAEILLGTGVLFLKNRKLKAVIYLVTAVLAGISAIIPGILIHLCMMAEMRCRAVMRPAVVLSGIMIIIIAISGLVSELAESERH